MDLEGREPHALEETQGRCEMRAVTPWFRILRPELDMLTTGLQKMASGLGRVAAGMALLGGVLWSATASPWITAGGASRLEPDLKGLVLVEELNCVACHAAEGGLSERSKKSPRLGEIGARVNPSYLEAFIENPHQTKPGTTMPDVLARLRSEERKETATALTHFLLSLKPQTFELQPPDAVAADLGQTLFHSRGCAVCHSPRDAKGAEVLAAESVPLGSLEGKYSFKSLVEFLRQPHASRPSGRMPDVRLPSRELERIAHYLLRSTQVPGALGYTLYRGQVWEGLRSENVKPERAGHVKDFALSSLGSVSHHTAIQYAGWMKVDRAGMYAFHLTWNGGSLVVDGRERLQLDPSDRRGVKSMEVKVELTAGWHPLALVYYHTGHDPRFTFEMQGPDMMRQAIPTSVLSVSRDPIPVLQPFRVDRERAARGREWFGTLGCANCHDDLNVPAQQARSWAQLDPKRGCMSDGESGLGPRFGLSAEQQSWIRSAWSRVEQPKLNDEQRLRKTLATFNCIGCHEREGLGGVDPKRNSLFTGAQPSMGEQGRLPPPLSQVGAKLRPEWIASVLMDGKRQRTYLNASMPQFGEANMRPLVALFGNVDRLEPATIPAVKNVETFKNAGYEMIGTTGLSCIVCHEFNGQKTGEVSAVDLVRVPERLQKNWFHLYLRQPSRFHPGVIMPSYWPDGQSVRADLLHGDAGQQIEAIWTYLEDGPRAKKPVGLSRESTELRIGDVTEIYRGQTSVGYRGIGVGYPERLNLVFEAGEMALRQLWKGEFVGIAPGSFQPRGTDLITLPPGVPFHRLKSMEENWPYKGKLNHSFPQDHGYQFRGYHLDANRRPTFLYRFGDILVEDHFEDMRNGQGKAVFERTLRFECPVESSPFYFRAAAGKRVTRRSAREFSLDKLEVRILTRDHEGIVREGETGEVLIPLKVPQGRSMLNLEYQW